MKPQPILCDMPLHIKQTIVSHVDTQTKLSSLICCSKEYKELVENSPVQFHSLYLNVWYQEVRLDARFLKTTYNTELGHHEFSYLNKSKVTTGEVCIEEGIENFMNFWKNPHVCVDSLAINVNGSYHENQFSTRLQEPLNNLQHKLSVKSLFLNELKNDEACLSTLSSCKAAFLEDISIKSENQNFQMNRIVKTEQWIRAKRVEASGFQTSLPHSDWSHFEVVRIYTRHLTLPLVKDIIENFLHNPRIQLVIINSSGEDYEEINSYLDTLLGDEKPLLWMSGGKEYLAITLEHQSIEIRRNFTISHLF